MLDRTRARKHIPFCPTMPEYVDRYSWPDKDLRIHDCVNGYYIDGVYAADGSISFSLPLENYPMAHEVSDEIAMTGPVHFHARDRRLAEEIRRRYKPPYSHRYLEGLYERGSEYENPILRKYK